MKRPGLVWLAAAFIAGAMSFCCTPTRGDIRAALDAIGEAAGP